MPGFRPGKVPPNVLKQRYGEAVLGEVMEKAVSDSANQAMQERGMRPALEPKIEIQEYKEGADLEYTLAIEVLPEVVPMDFSTVKLERLVAKIPKRKSMKHWIVWRVDKRSRSPSMRFGRLCSATSWWSIFVGRIEGKEFAGGAAEDYHLELGSGMFIEGFEEQLLGKSPGDQVTVNVTFPEEYGNDELKGKPAEFSVTVKSLEETIPAVIDDEFAKANGFDTLAALRDGVRESLRSNYDTITQGRLKRDLLDQLANGHDFPVPQGMVDLEFDIIWRQIEEAREKNELDDEDKAKSEDELKSEYGEIAKRRVRLGLLLSEVGQASNIEVTDQEVNQAVMAEAQRHPGHEREVFELYQKNPAAKANLRAPIFENKVVDYIVELAKVEDREVSPEDLMKDDEAEAEPKKAPAKKKSATKAAAKKGWGQNGQAKGQVLDLRSAWTLTQATPQRRRFPDRRRRIQGVSRRCATGTRTMPRI